METCVKAVSGRPPETVGRIPARITVENEPACQVTEKDLSADFGRLGGEYVRRLAERITIDDGDVVVRFKYGTEVTIEVGL